MSMCQAAWSFYLNSQYWLSNWIHKNKLLSMANFNQNTTTFSWKCILKYQPFCSDLNVLTKLSHILPCSVPVPQSYVWGPQTCHSPCVLWLFPGRCRPVWGKRSPSLTDPPVRLAPVNASLSKSGYRVKEIKSDRSSHHCITSKLLQRPFQKCPT